MIVRIWFLIIGFPSKFAKVMFEVFSAKYKHFIFLSYIVLKILYTTLHKSGSTHIIMKELVKSTELSVIANQISLCKDVCVKLFSWCCVRSKDEFGILSKTIAQILWLLHPRTTPIPQILGKDAFLLSFLIMWGFLSVWVLSQG